MGVEHIHNIAAVDGAEVVALADPEPESLKSAEAAVDGPVTSYSDYRELVSDGICDALVIASPNMTHKQVLDDVLGTNHHLLIEKPLCTTVDDCQMIVEAAKSHPGKIWMGLEYRYMAPIEELIRRSHNGDVGKLQMVAIREHRFPFLEKVGDWNRFSENTGGTLVEKCCHFFDLMIQIFDDKPVRVMASGGQNVNHLNERYDGRQPDILDNAYVIVEFSNNRRAMLDLCMFAEATQNQEEVSVVGDLGKLEALIPDDIIRFGKRGEHTFGSVVTEPVVNDSAKFAGYHHGASYLEHVDFLDCIREDRPPLVTLEDGLWSVAVGAAAHLSIDEQRPVDIAEVLAPQQKSGG